MKNITVIKGAGGAHHDLVIRPGTTSREILSQVGLERDYVLRSGNNPAPFGDDENVYEQIGDGSKLVATTPVTVGVEGPPPLPSQPRPWWLQLFDTVLGHEIADAAPQNQPEKEVPTLIAGKPVVPRDTRPLWMQKGWKQDDHEYVGFFRTCFGAWRGRLRITPSRKVEVFIRNPPGALRSHPHWACFHALTNGWYFVHHYGVYELSSAIVQIESILAEAFQKRTVR